MFSSGGQSLFFPSSLETHKKVAKKQLPGVNNNILSYEILSFSFPKCKFCQSEMLHHFTTSSATHVQPTARQSWGQSPSSLRVFLVLVLCVCAFRINSRGRFPVSESWTRQQGRHRRIMTTTCWLLEEGQEAWLWLRSVHSVLTKLCSLSEYLQYMDLFPVIQKQYFCAFFLFVLYFFK